MQGNCGRFISCVLTTSGVQSDETHWRVGDDVIEIRTERPQDSAAIQEVHSKAFGGPVEAKLVQLICERKKALISLVAVSDGKIVGHILFSKVTIASSPNTFNAVGLGPVAVLPEFQRTGIGSKLIRDGLKQCQQAGYDAVVLVGEPAYYSRFGFSRAADFGLQNEYGVHDEFMVLPLRDGALAGVNGMVKYQPEFQEAES
jgi:putative acetyltransferase